MVVSTFYTSSALVPVRKHRHWAELCPYLVWKTVLSMVYHQRFRLFATASLKPNFYMMHFMCHQLVGQFCNSGICHDYDFMGLNSSLQVWCIEGCLLRATSIGASYTALATAMIMISLGLTSQVFNRMAYCQKFPSISIASVGPNVSISCFTTLSYLFLDLPLL